MLKRIAGTIKEESKWTLEQRDSLEKDKRIKQLEMENDILNQAALIWGESENC